MSNDIGQYAEMFDSMLSYRIDPAVAHKAIRSVCSVAADAPEARRVISMLGLDEFLAGVR